MEERPSPSLPPGLPAARDGAPTALPAAAALTGAISTYALLAVVVLLSAQHPRGWEIWLLAVPAVLLALSVALAACAARRRKRS